MVVVVVYLRPPSMCEYLLWERKSCCHKKCRPVNCVKSKDILLLIVSRKKLPFSRVRVVFQNNT